jgi:hypothetical protein
VINNHKTSIFFESSASDVELNSSNARAYEVLTSNGLCEIQDSKIRFSFVGIVITYSETIIVFPKYLYNRFKQKNLTPESFLKEHSSFLLRIFNEYDVSSKVLLLEPLSIFQKAIYSENLLKIIEYLLSDYTLYGLWHILESEIQIINESDIIWDKTIEISEPLITKNKPLYYDIRYISSKEVYSTIVTEIHKWAIKYAYDNFNDILGYTDFDYLDALEDLSILGDLPFLLASIDKELYGAFNDRSIILLNNLRQFLLQINDQTNFSIYGHNRFEYVWEACISSNFNNQYSQYRDLIPSVCWYNSSVSVYKKTIRPDVIKWKLDIKSVLFIIDAKYYLLEFTNNNVLNNPGLEDITKQYFYQSVLSLRSLQFPWCEYETQYLNYFLFPSKLENAEIISCIGYVHLPNSYSENPIILLEGNPDILFKHYIEHKPIDDQILQMIIPISIS